MGRWGLGSQWGARGARGLEDERGGAGMTAGNREWEGGIGSSA